MDDAGIHGGRLGVERVGSERGSAITEPNSGASVVQRVAPLGFPFETRDPFLFCVHHDDLYPAGNAQLGPSASLAGRNLGQDFTVKDGFRMYHGVRVPGFPQHPHRGFETVTFVRRGYVDHSDSLRAAGRYGQGDVQWMTAGRGVLHAEMFPLLEPGGPNRLELFQIWLNLPASRKLVEPEYKMLWAEQIPKRTIVDGHGGQTNVTIVAGTFDGVSPLAPPKHSWAADPGNDVAIWMLEMSPGASLTLPAALAGTNRSLFLVSGSGLHVGEQVLGRARLAEVLADRPLRLTAGAEPVEVLLLQGQPIAEPVVQQGPFVMNSREEIVQTIREYQRTQFGGWPWQRDDVVHEPSRGRFALHADGREEIPT
jgi:redox-sensitive bicupin YhaK (pirin superfamily)